jgi:hypothetical protein
MAKASPPQLSGSLTWTANLGLSDLSSVEAELGQGGNGPGGSGPGEGGGAGLLSALSGSYQASIWLGGATAEHLALSQSTAEELDLVRSGRQAWFWDSTTQTVTHFVAEGAKADGAVPPVALTPQELAARLVGHLSPTTSLTTGSPVYVAGQAAYRLLVAPKAASGSTVDHVEIDVGASGTLSGVPLQVAVYAVGEEVPALEVGFTGVLHLGPPAESELTFTPPPGAKVVTRDIAEAPGRGRTGALGDLGLGTSGSGWTAVVTGSGPRLASAVAQGPFASMTSVVRVGAYRARLLSTYLLNVLVMPDGHFYAGFVVPDVLEAAASSAA